MFCSFCAILISIRHHDPRSFTLTLSREACTSIVTNDTPFVSSHVILSESDRAILVGALFLYSLRVGCWVLSYRTCQWYLELLVSHMFHQWCSLGSESSVRRLKWPSWVSSRATLGLPAPMIRLAFLSPKSQRLGLQVDGWSPCSRAR